MSGELLPLCIHRTGITSACGCVDNNAYAEGALVKLQQTQYRLKELFPRYCKSFEKEKQIEPWQTSQAAPGFCARLSPHRSRPSSREIFPQELRCHERCQIPCAFYWLCDSEGFFWTFDNDSAWTAEPSSRTGYLGSDSFTKPLVPLSALSVLLSECNR